MGAGVDLIELAAEILELHVLGVEVGVCEGGAQQAVCDKADNGDEGDDAPEHGVGPALAGIAHDPDDAEDVEQDDDGGSGGEKDLDGAGEKLVEDFTHGRGLLVGTRGERRGW